jgi:hypothetical protein
LYFIFKKVCSFKALIANSDIYHHHIQGAIYNLSVDLLTTSKLIQLYMYQNLLHDPEYRLLHTAHMSNRYMYLNARARLDWRCFMTWRLAGAQAPITKDLENNTYLRPLFLDILNCMSQKKIKKKKSQNQYAWRMRISLYTAVIFFMMFYLYV